MNRAATLPLRGRRVGNSVSRRAVFTNAQAVIFLSPPPTLLLLPQLYEAFTFLKGLGAVILVHAENGDLIAQVSGLMSTLSTPVHVPALSRRDWRGALVSGWLGHEGSG